MIECWSYLSWDFPEEVAAGGENMTFFELYAITCKSEMKLGKCDRHI